MPPMTADQPFARGRGPEEIALDAWLEDSSHYVSLPETKARRRPEPVSRPASPVLGAARDN